VRPLELTLLLVVLYRCLRPQLTGRSHSPFAVAAAITVAGLVHVLVESPRWQMAPLYLAAAAASISAARTGARRRGDRGAACGPHAGLTCAVTAAAAAVGALAAWALPVPELPVPSGDRPIGTTTVELTDLDRLARYGERPTAPRRLVAQAWYPTPADGASSAWVSEGAAFGRAVADWLELPAPLLDHLGLVRSTATEDAPIAGSEPLPVVVYVHGWGGFRSVQATLAEALASHGYVVVALDHTYGSVATRFTDGEVVPIDPSALPTDASSDTYDEASRTLVTTFADDVRFLLDELEAGTIPVLGDGLDLERVGLVGHSTGGGAAIDVCASDPRCATVIGFDPWVEPVGDTIIGSGLAVPTLSLRSEEWVDHPNDARLRRLHAASQDVTGLAAIAGTTHRDVTMLPLLTPLAGVIGLAGDTDGRRTHRIVEAWTLGFLDAHLRGQPDRDPLDGSSTFTEVTLDE
jgi:dienelactone hydrolase